MTASKLIVGVGCCLLAIDSVVVVLMSSSRSTENQEKAQQFQSDAQQTEAQRAKAAQCEAVATFWDIYTNLLAAPVNTPAGVTDISNRLEAAISPDLDERFRNFGIDTITALRSVAANTTSSGVIQQVVNGAIAYGSGEVPNIDLGGTEQQEAAIKKSLASIQGGAIRLRLIAHTEFDVDLMNGDLLYSWTWTPGTAWTDDYAIIRLCLTDQKFGAR